MSEITKLESWIKSHKGASAAIAGGAGFIYLQRKGNSSSTATDTTGTLAAPIDNSSLQDTTPLDEAVANAQQSADNAAAAAQQISDAATSTQDQTGTDTTSVDTGTTGDTAPPDSTDTGSAGAGSAPIEPNPPTAVNQGSGITIAGHTFSGATSSQIVGAGSNSNGHYTTYLIVYPSRTERWNHYSTGKKAGHWVGPFGGNVTSSAPPGVAPAPVPTTSPAPSASPTKYPLPGGYIGGYPFGLKPSNLGMVVGSVLGYKNIGSGSNSNGSYTSFRFFSDVGATGDWNYYSSGAKKGQWVGPFNLGRNP